MIHVTVITRWITQENFDLTVRNVSAQSSSRQALVIPTDRTESFRYFCEPSDRRVINPAKPPAHWLKSDRLARLTPGGYNRSRLLPVCTETTASDEPPATGHYQALGRFDAYGTVRTFHV